MADLAASDVSYSILKRDVVGQAPKQRVVASLSFGDGAKTYPTGGVPLTRGKLALPNEIESLVFVDPANANGFLYKYDATNRKIRIYQGDNDNAADAPLIELAGGVATPAAATLRVEAIGW